MNILQFLMNESLAEQFLSVIIVLPNLVFFIAVVAARCVSANEVYPFPSAFRTFLNLRVNLPCRVAFGVADDSAQVAFTGRKDTVI